MGGIGSGWRNRPSSQPFVDDAESLDAGWLQRRKALVPGGLTRGFVESTKKTTKGKKPAIHFRADTRRLDAASVRLRHRVDGLDRSVAYDVPLTATFIGPRHSPRWWFICPATADGVPCGRRVKKLYLPPGAVVFACRTCHDLTYPSRILGRQFMDMVRAMDPTPAEDSQGTQPPSYEESPPPAKEEPTPAPAGILTNPPPRL